MHKARAGDTREAKSSLPGEAADLLAEPRPARGARAAPPLGYGGRFIWDVSPWPTPQLVRLLEDGLSAAGREDRSRAAGPAARASGRCAARRSPPAEPGERISAEALAPARRLAIRRRWPSARGLEAALHAPQNAARRLASWRPRSSRSPPRRETGNGASTDTSSCFWTAWELGDATRRATELDFADAGSQTSSSSLRSAGRSPSRRRLLALSAGDFSEAEELIERAAAIGARVLTWEAVCTRRLQRFLLRRERGELAGFEAEVRDHAHEFPSPLLHAAVLADICAQLERVGEATALVREVASRDLSNWHVDEEWLVSVCLLAESCALRRGDGVRRPSLRRSAAVRLAQRGCRARTRARLRGGRCASASWRRCWGALRMRRGTSRTRRG